MAASPKKSLALDTNLLLDLAGDKDFAHEFKEEFSSRGFTLLVPPTVVAELSFFASLKDAPQHEIANVALEKMSGWKCQPFTLSSTQLAIAIQFAMRLMGFSLIPETEGVSQGGSLWADEPAPASGVFGSGEHCGGVGERDEQGLPAFPLHRPRLPH
jgi:hypothetical protein